MCLTRLTDHPAWHHGTLAKTAKALLCALLACSFAVFIGCTAAPDETVHLTLKLPRTGHDVIFDENIAQVDQVMEIMAEDFEANYNRPVDIDVEVFEQNQYDTAVVDAFDTSDAPDILYGDYFNISTYIHTGRVVPLDDAITPQIKDGVYDYLWNMSTIQDHIYMAPYLARQNVLAYNKDLFEQAGLSTYIHDGIQSWTLEEWEHVLDTLAANLPSGSFPMMMYARSSQGDTHTMTLLRACGGTFFDESGHFNLSTPEGIAALAWIQDGVSRGWFPPHAENLEIEDCSSLFRAGQLGIYMVNNASIGRYGDTIGLVNFPNGSEKGCATTFVSGFEVFDNGDQTKVQIAKDFLAHVYNSEELMAYAAGTLPASKAVAEQYGKDILMFEEFLDNRQNVVDFTGNNPDTRSIREIFHERMYDLLIGRATPEETAKALDEECNHAIDVGIATSTLHD